MTTVRSFWACRHCCPWQTPGVLTPRTSSGLHALEVVRVSPLFSAMNPPTSFPMLDVCQTVGGGGADLGL